MDMVCFTTLIGYLGLFNSHQYHSKQTALSGIVLYWLLVERCIARTHFEENFYLRVTYKTFLVA